MTPHPAFADALAAVSALLGSPAALDRYAVPLADTWVSTASWRGEEPGCVTLRVYDDGDVMLVAEHPDLGGHQCHFDDGAAGPAVRAAREWLRWTVPS